MITPAKTWRRHQSLSPDLKSQIAPAIGLPINNPKPTQIQYIPDRVPITVMGQKRGMNAPGSATRKPEIMPQKIDHTIVPAVVLTEIQQSSIIDPKTIETEKVSVDPNLAPVIPAIIRPTAEAPFMISRRLNARSELIEGILTSVNSGKYSNGIRYAVALSSDETQSIV